MTIFRCFRQTILIWIPSAFLWLSTPLELIYNVQSRCRPIPWNIRNMSRILSVALICLISLMDSIFWTYIYMQYELPVSNSRISSSFINFATFTLLEVLILWHRRKGMHTSGVVWIFSLLALVCGTPTVYQNSFSSSPEYIYEFISYLLYYSLIIILFLISCFADSAPKLITYSTESPELSQKLITGHIPDVQQNCPEIEASFLSKLTFWWFNGLAITGYRKTLTTSDLWCLKPEDKTDSIAPQFDNNWLKQKITKNYQNITESHVIYDKNEPKITVKSSKPVKTGGVVTTLVKTFGGHFLSGAILKLFYDLLQFVSPLILKQMIAFVSKPSWVEPVWHGYYFALLIFMVSCLQSILVHYYFNIMFVVGMRVRTALTSAVYRKALYLSNSTRMGTTTGNIVNLMSVDTQMLSDVLPYINLVWSAPLQISLALYFLWQELGPSVLAGLAVMALMLPLNALLAGYQQRLQTKQMAQKDERVKTMTEILNGIRVIKLFSWGKAFMETLSSIRNIELINLKHIAYLACGSTFIWTCAPILVAFTTFGVYVLSDPNHVLDAQKAFVSLALFNLLSFPMTMLPQMITSVVMTCVSVKRLNKFLNSSQLEGYVERDEERDAIVIENGTFTWNTDGEDMSGVENRSSISVTNTLTDINLKIGKGSLVAVVGTVGCGKSSLISAILGEMDRVFGTVNISRGSKIAYVPQQAWIQNTSLKNNIIFGQTFNKQKYNQIINCCALRADLSILPAGDETEIGEKGINLSGGQKQRVSIARACYSGADIVLLDDPLSAVDAQVAKHIFQRVLSNKNGFLRQKTRIFVTNSVNFLPKVDEIVVLKDGSINEIGSYGQLMQKKGDFFEFIRDFSGNNEPSVQRQESVVSTGMDRSVSVEEKPENSKLIETEGTETGKVKLPIYMRYFRALTWFWLSLMLATLVGMQAASVGANVWLAVWSGDNTSAGTQDTDQRYWRLSVYGLLGLLQACLMLLSTYAIARGSVTASRTLHNTLLERILRSPMSFFDTTPIGRIVNRFSKDINTVDTYIAQIMMGWLLCLCSVLATSIVIGVEIPMFLIVILPIAFFYYFIQKFYISTVRQLKRMESVSRSPIYSHFSETLSGVSTIRAYDSSHRFITDLNCKVDTNNVCYYPSITANRWLGVWLELCANTIALFVSIFGVLGRDSFEERPGFVGLIITYAMSVTQELNWLVRMTSDMETNIVSVERIAEYCDNPTEAEWDSQPSCIPPANWPNNGRIEFIDYSVRYRPGLELVVRDINAVINGSEKIGIVGRTGAGKSSLTLALFRLLESSNGKIVIDGIDISRLGLHDLRSRLTIIPQEPILFSGTVRSNLDPFKKHTDAQIWTALEHSHLKPYIIGLESQLDHKLSEGGDNLSLGQKQLICLARALLHRTNILVLDEATAAVDLETDSLIQTTIRQEFKDCTVLTIAHRLHTIIDSDRVLVLARGQLAELDTPANLLQNTDSIFYSLAKDSHIL